MGSKQKPTEIVKTPWTEEQVKALNEYQNNGWMHPYTCGNNRSDKKHKAYQEKHGGDFGQLVATVDGWVCPVCGYKQDWFNSFSLL